MGRDSEISGIAYNGFLVRRTSPGTISSQESWIFVLACSYLVGYGPIFTWADVGSKAHISQTANMYPKKEKGLNCHLFPT